MKSTIHNLSQLAQATSLNLTGGSKTLGFELQRLGHGLGAGLDRVTLVCGSTKIDVLPTRGMGIWQADNNGVRFGWDSPIEGPVHPMWVPIAEPGGLGWLDGFDEMMVRCGLASNGAPEFDEQGKLVWPLHGRIANLPASDVQVDIDEDAGRIAIRGTVNENRFHFQRLQLQTEIALQVDSDEIEIVDRVTNLSARPAVFQMLYHNNFGPPILESGTQLFAPIKKLVPRNAHAAAELNQWNQYGPPNPGSAEKVYFMELAGDKDNWSIAVLANSDRSAAASIRFDKTHLPCFSVWKNTVGPSDGYVTGLEPATNFPNPRSFEESHGRVVPLAPGESCEFQLNIGMLTNAASVQQAIEQVDALSSDEANVMEQPHPDWCAPG
jgi:galactose mutarotase-like enzyme